MEESLNFMWREQKQWFTVTNNIDYLFFALPCHKWSIMILCETQLKIKISHKKKHMSFLWMLSIDKCGFDLH